MSNPNADRLSYDMTTNIYDVDFSKLNLKYKAEVDALWEAIDNYWDINIKRKSYILVNYSDFSPSSLLTSYWAIKVRAAVMKMAITSVRYSNQTMVRTVVRTSLIKVHLPSNMYGSRQEALAVIDGLKSRSVELGAMPAQAAGDFG